MNYKNFVFSLIACGLTACASKTPSAPQPAPQQVQAPAMPTPEEMMRIWTEYSTPREEHKVLQQLEGNWNYSLSWWTDPSSKPEISKGRAQNKMILGGRFLEQRVTGTSMGKPFEGRGLIGYDNAKKEYTSVWLDNMGTGIMQATAKFDPAAKTLTEHGKFTCPMTNGDKSFRAQWTLGGKDGHKYEMFMTDPTGKEFRSMEIVYQRAGAKK